MRVNQSTFAELEGQTVHSFTIKNNQGVEISCINYGCVITKILTPDIEENFENIVLGFDSMEKYQRYSEYFGAVVGRTAGRTKNGQISLNGVCYQLTQNENNNHIHGGFQGFSDVLWQASIIERENEAGVVFTYTSPDGEEGYPGNLEMKVTYLLNNQNELTIFYDGKADQTTVLNTTNHSYFNLSGNLKRDILDHVLTMKSDRFIEIDDESLPTGEILDVDQTPFDFREGRTLRDGATSSHEQNRLAGKGYDHPFLLTAHYQREIVLEDPDSRRQLIVETDEPCVVLYSGNQLTDDFKIRGTQSKKYLGVCLETQKPPDAVHHENFPSIVLEKGTPYHSKTKYTFSVSES